MLIAARTSSNAASHPPRPREGRLQGHNRGRAQTNDIREAPRPPLGHAKPIRTCPALALCEPSAACEAREQQALAVFVRAAGLEHGEVARVMAKAPGNKLETAKLYVVLADAVNGKVTTPRAERFRVVMGALRDGRIHVQTAELRGSRAEYNHTTNTVRVPADGIALTCEADRVALVHEAEHVAQDIHKASQSRYASEGEGHEAAADYLLHLAGALTEDGVITRIDVNRASEAIGALQARGYEGVDVVAATHLCFRLARLAAARGEDVDESEVQQIFSAESFAKAYLSAQEAMGRGGLALEAVMTKSGL